MPPGGPAAIPRPTPQAEADPSVIPAGPSQFQNISPQDRAWVQQQSQFQTEPMPQPRGPSRYILSDSMPPSGAPPQSDPRTGKPILQNPDGSVSTERTIGVEADGKHYLIPTIVAGKPVSREEAIARWRAGSNQAVGVFRTREDADRAAAARSQWLGQKPRFTPEWAARENATEASTLGAGRGGEFVQSALDVAAAPIETASGLLTGTLSGVGRPLAALGANAAALLTGQPNARRYERAAVGAVDKIMGAISGQPQSRLAQTATEVAGAPFAAPIQALTWAGMEEDKAQALVETVGLVAPWLIGKYRGGKGAPPNPRAFIADASDMLAQEARTAEGQRKVAVLKALQDIAVWQDTAMGKPVTRYPPRETGLADTAAESQLRRATEVGTPQREGPGTRMPLGYREEVGPRPSPVEPTEPVMEELRQGGRPDVQRPPVRPEESFSERELRERAATYQPPGAERLGPLDVVGKPVELAARPGETAVETARRLLYEKQQAAEMLRQREALRTEPPSSGPTTPTTPTTPTGQGPGGFREGLRPPEPLKPAGPMERKYTAKPSPPPTAKPSPPPTKEGVDPMAPPPGKSSLAQQLAEHEAEQAKAEAAKPQREPTAEELMTPEQRAARAKALEENKRLKAERAAANEAYEASRGPARDAERQRLELEAQNAQLREKAGLPPVTGKPYAKGERPLSREELAEKVVADPKADPYDKRMAEEILARREEDLAAADREAKQPDPRQFESLTDMLERPRDEPEPDFFAEYDKKVREQEEAKKKVPGLQPVTPEEEAMGRFGRTAWRRMTPEQQATAIKNIAASKAEEATRNTADRALNELLRYRQQESPRSVPETLVDKFLQDFEGGSLTEEQRAAVKSQFGQGQPWSPYPEAGVTYDAAGNRISQAERLANERAAKLGLPPGTSEEEMWRVAQKQKMSQIGDATFRRMTPEQQAFLTAPTAADALKARDEARFRELGHGDEAARHLALALRTLEQERNTLAVTPDKGGLRVPFTEKMIDDQLTYFEGGSLSAAEQAEVKKVFGQRWPWKDEADAALKANQAVAKETFSDARKAKRSRGQQELYYNKLTAEIQDMPYREGFAHLEKAGVGPAVSDMILSRVHGAEGAAQFKKAGKTDPRAVLDALQKSNDILKNRFADEQAEKAASPEALAEAQAKLRERAETPEARKAAFRAQLRKEEFDRKQAESIAGAREALNDPSEVVRESARNHLRELGVDPDAPDPMAPPPKGEVYTSAKEPPEVSKATVERGREEVAKPATEKYEDWVPEGETPAEIEAAQADIYREAAAKPPTGIGPAPSQMTEAEISMLKRAEPVTKPIVERVKRRGVTTAEDMAVQEELRQGPAGQTRAEALTRVRERERMKQAENWPANSPYEVTDRGTPGETIKVLGKEIVPSKAEAPARALLEDLDAVNAPDLQYRRGLSTWSKDPLKKGETWRARLERFAEHQESDLDSHRMSKAEAAAMRESVTSGEPPTAAELEALRKQREEGRQVEPPQAKPPVPETEVAKPPAKFQGQFDFTEEPTLAALEEVSQKLELRPAHQVDGVYDPGLTGKVGDGHGSSAEITANIFELEKAGKKVTSGWVDKNGKWYTSKEAAAAKDATWGKLFKDSFTETGAASSRAGELTLEEQAKERMARASRRELYDRIIEIARTTGVTVEEAARGLGVSPARFEMIRAEAMAARPWSPLEVEMHKNADDPKIFEPIAEELQGGRLSTDTTHRIAKAFIETYEKAGLRLDPKLPVSIQIARDLAAHVIDNADLTERLYANGASPEQMGHGFLASESSYGRGLQQISEVRRRLQEAGVKFGDYPPPVTWSKYGIELGRRWINIWKGMLVTQASTAIRNLETQTGRLTIDGVENVIDGLLSRAMGIGPDHERGLRAGMGQAFETWASLLSPEKRKQAMEILNVWPNQKDRLFHDYMGDIAMKHANGMALPPGRLARALENITEAGESSAQFLNYFNTAQEFLIRRAGFRAHLAETLARRGIDIENIPPGAVTMQDIAGSVDHSLALTFATVPTKGLGKWMMDLYRLVPPLSFVAPFPKFMWNSWKFMFDYSPAGFLKLLSKREREALSGPRTSEAGGKHYALPQEDIEMVKGNPYHKETGEMVPTYESAVEARAAARRQGDTKTLSRALIGTGLLGAAYGLRNSEYAGDKWYEIKPGGKNGTYSIDARPMNPFATYMWIADVVNKARLGQLDRLGFKDVMQGLFSANLRAGTGLFMLDKATDLMGGAASYLSTGNWTGGPIEAGKSIKRAAGETLAGFLTPLQTFRDFLSDDRLMGLFGRDAEKFANLEAKPRDVTDSPFWDPMKARIPYLSQSVPERRFPLGKKETGKEEPMVRQLTGLILRDKTPAQSEADRLGFNQTDLLRPSGISKLDRLTAQGMRGPAEGYLHLLLRTQDYRRASDTQKRVWFAKAMHDAANDARQEVLAKDPQLRYEYIIKQAGKDQGQLLRQQYEKAGILKKPK